MNLVQCDIVAFIMMTHDVSRDDIKIITANYTENYFCHCKMSGTEVIGTVFVGTRLGILDKMRKYYNNK